MTQEGYKRKLTAILSADVQGYSRLMGEDEDATIRTLTTYRELMTTLIQKHRGRVVDSPGDNLLAEFLSVVDAVRCAVEIQEELRVRNAELPENRRMHFRIGINLGDVVQEEERIYGDGINIAARVEGLAEGGGICISGTVYDSIKNKLSLTYESLGEHTVKNITEPVRVYRMRVGPEAAVKPKPKHWHKAALAAVAVLVVAAGAWAIWNFYFRPPSVEPASVEKMAYPLPDKPSVAVLPFDNMSADPAQEYLSDGLTEEIITGLSKAPQMFVIARNSTFTYKGKPVKIKEVAEDLGVRYVLEGSVRKEGDRLRITAQLIDATTGHHIWAERYDREYRDIFALNDEITLKIVTALQIELTEGEQARLYGKSTKDLEAFGKVLQGREYFRRMDKNSNLLARKMFEEAISMDPQYAVAYCYLGYTHWMDVMFGASKSPKQSIGLAAELAQKAIAINESLPLAHGLLAYLYTMKRQHDKGIAEGERAIALDPNSADSHLWLAYALRYSGRPKEALTYIEKAIRLNPYPPTSYFLHLGAIYRMTEHYEEAIAAYKKALQRKGTNLWAHIGLAATYVSSGHEEEAQVEASEVLKIDPKLSLDRLAKRLPYKNEADRESLIAALRKAGLPETPPLPLPDKPSIAVLPFVNMSDDKIQEYFSDGLTEEIITALSKAPQLFVIASNTSFTYKGKPVKVRQVSKELGVRYVIEGSVRRAGERVRVTAQMIDALKDRHLWAERYDKEFKDVFSIQDDITKKIITAVHIKLTEGERARVFAKGTSNLQSYLKAVQADWFVNQATKDSVLRAQQLAEEAIALDPNYAYAHMALGSVQIYYLFLGMSQSPRDTLMRAIKQYQKAVALNPESGEAHALLAYGLVMARQYDKAVAECEKAMVLEPNSYKPLYHCASALTFVGRREEAIPMFREALRINPKPPNSLYRHFGVAFRDSGQYDEAIELSKKAVERKPNDIIAYVVLASSYGLAGREEEAKAAAKEILRINPKYSVDRLEKVSPHKDRAVAKRFCDALRKAGLK